MKDTKNISEELQRRLQMAFQKMLNKAKLLDEEIVIADKEGNIKTVKARDFK